MSIKGEQKDTLICPLPRSNNPSSSAIKNGELAETELFNDGNIKTFKETTPQIKTLIGK